MKQMITFWKNSGHPALRGKTVEVFRVGWDEALFEWVKDENGPHLGMYKLGTQEVRKLSKPPEELGLVEDFYEEDQSDVDALEAKDVTVTPEGLDLGEEEGQ